MPAPSSSTTVGLPVPRHSRYSRRPPMSTRPAKSPCVGGAVGAIPWAATVSAVMRSMASTPLAVARRSVRRAIGRDGPVDLFRMPFCHSTFVWISYDEVVCCSAFSHPVVQEGAKGRQCPRAPLHPPRPGSLANSRPHPRLEWDQPPLLLPPARFVDIHDRRLRE